MSATGAGSARANKRGDSTQRRLLEAAFQITRDLGSSSLTLEAVAAEAKTSKGGLLYHFPTKDALLRAMVEDALDRFHADVDARVASDKGPGREARGYVRESMAEGEDGYKRWAALLAAFFSDPSLAEIWRHRSEEWSRLDSVDGANAVDSLVARLAADGLWIRELIGVSPVEPRLRRVLEKRLVELTRSP